jgi:predicted amidohydrolase
LARGIAYIRKAASDGANLAVLPEYQLGDFLPEDPKFRDQCANWKVHLDTYCSLAKECNICIVPGSAAELHRDETTGTEAIYNVVYFIDNTGTVAGRYAKKNLWHPERLYVKSSQHDAHVAFDTPLGKVGMLVCWDVAFPEAFRELIAQGAKLIIVPSFWKLTDCAPQGTLHNQLAEQVFLDAALISRACENTCAVVFCNAGGPADDGFAGLSQVTVPFLGCIGRVETCEEGMKIVDLNMGLLEDAESVYKIRQDLARPDWHYSYTIRDSI